MKSEKLQEVREQLNQLIEMDADYGIILQVSVELDRLIEAYMDEVPNFQ